MMSDPSESYNYGEDTFTSATPTEQFTYGTDTFEKSPDSHSVTSSHEKSYETDTFVTGTVTQDSYKYSDSFDTHDSRNYSDTFESTSDSKRTLANSQSTVIESPRKTVTRYSYSTDSFERSSLTGSHYASSFESDSGTRGPTYSDTFEESQSDETERSWTPTVSEDSEVVREARAAEAKFLDDKYEKLLYGGIELEKKEPTGTSPRKSKSRGEKQLNSYCKQKLEVLRNKQNGDATDFKKTTSRSSKGDQTSVENYGVSEGTVSRLKIQNLINRMKQVASAEVHSPKHCRDCRHQIAQYKQDEYLKHKTAIARRKMVDERYESLCAKDSLAIFGEMIGSLPKLSDDPQDVWERLMKPLNERDMNKGQDSHPGS